MIYADNLRLVANPDPQEGDDLPLYLVVQGKSKEAPSKTGVLVLTKDLVATL